VNGGKAKLITYRKKGTSCHGGKGREIKGRGEVASGFEANHGWNGGWERRASNYEEGSDSQKGKIFEMPKKGRRVLRLPGQSMVFLRFSHKKDRGVRGGGHDERLSQKGALQ